MKLKGSLRSVEKCAEECKGFPQGLLVICGFLYSQSVNGNTWTKETVLDVFQSQEGVLRGQPLQTKASLKE